MAAGGHSNMVPVGNHKIIMWSLQNSLVIFTFIIVVGNIFAAFQTYFGILAVSFAYKRRALGGLSKMANLLQHRLITNNELLDPVLFFRSVAYQAS